MKFGVIVFPGSNCDQDTVYVIREILEQDVVTLWHKETNFNSNIDVIILPGGFSYGDYLRSGALAKFSPIMNRVIDFANNGGYVLAFVMVFKYFARVAFCQEHYSITPAKSLSAKTHILYPIARVLLLQSFYHAIGH